MVTRGTVNARHVGPRCPSTSRVLLLVAVFALGTLTACGASSSPGTYVGDEAVEAVDAELQAEGRVAYYLGPEAGGLALTNIERVTENGPDFQVFTAYGTCRPAAFDDGGCMDPMSVDTMDWRADMTGSSCQRLEPQLGVPAGLIMGELTLFTERLTVRVLNAEDLADYDGHRGLALLPSLRRVGATAPVGTLPAPAPELARWVDVLCGVVPGAGVEHPIDEGPGEQSPPSTSPPSAPGSSPSTG